MNVSEIMSSDLCTVEVEATVADAATLMGENAVGSVMILDGERLAGILTERDIVRALSSDYEAPTRPVGEWMTRDPVTIAPDADARTALKVMLDGGFRHLPVVDGTKPVGMISIRDIAGHMAS